MNFRGLEKTEKFGYIFTLYYNGEKFKAFDEIEGKYTIKGEFKKIMNEIGFTWAKGIQQGGRTDAKVSAEKNLLYVSSNFKGDLEKIIKEFNIKGNGEIFIRKVDKTFPNLNFPDLVEKREYIYNYPKKYIKRDVEEIEKIIKELSGKYDVSRFTDFKGEKLKEHIREVKIEYVGKGKLKFTGNSFMPKQIRNMSGYIFIGKIESLPGKYLTLNEVFLKKSLKDKIIKEIELDEKIPLVEKVERTLDKSCYIFYVKRENKGNIIGKNGSNIKKLREKFENIVIREL